MPDLTTAQRRSLEAIREVRVYRQYHPRGYSWGKPRGIRADVIERLIGMGLARLGSIQQPGLIAPVVLTDKGREALDGS